MNPMIQLLAAVRNGNNPMQIAQTIANNDPQMRAAFNIINGKSPLELKSVCENMCKERGITVEELMRSLGF